MRRKLVALAVSCSIFGGTAGIVLATPASAAPVVRKKGRCERGFHYDKKIDACVHGHGPAVKRT